MTLLNHKVIGRVRRFLMVKGSNKWNGLVRSLTAKLG